MVRPQTASDPQRQLMIKTKTCQRLIKEWLYYQQEVQDNTSQLEQMIQDCRDYYDIKKFREVLGESEMMVPDAQKRLQHAIVDLQQYVTQLQEQATAEADDNNKSSDEALQGEWYETARQLIQEHHSSSTDDDGEPITALSSATAMTSDVRIQTSVAGLANDEIF